MKINNLIFIVGFIIIFMLAAVLFRPALSSYKNG